MTGAAGGTGGTSFDIQSVSRVGQILSIFGPGKTELTPGDVSDSVGLNRTTAYRYCTSLAQAGILQRGRRKGSFTLGPLLLQLGAQAIERRKVVEVAPPLLKKLSTDAGTTAVLSLWGTRAPVVTLVHENSSRSVLVTVRVGTELETDSAQMQVFLAYLADPSVVERTIEPLSSAERQAMEKAIFRTRRSGYCATTRPDGLFVAAAPVFDDFGICATVAIISPAHRNGPPDALIDALRSTAAELSDTVHADRSQKRP